MTQRLSVHHLQPRGDRDIIVNKTNEIMYTEIEKEKNDELKMYCEFTKLTEIIAIIMFVFMFVISFKSLEY